MEVGRGLNALCAGRPAATICGLAGGADIYSKDNDRPRRLETPRVPAQPKGEDTIFPGIDPDANWREAARPTMAGGP